MPDEPETVAVGQDVAALYRERTEAAAAVAAWTKRHKELTAELYDALGYDAEDTRPPSLSAVDAAGVPLFTVAVTYRRDIDKEYLKTRHPAAWAEAERDIPVKSVKPAKP